jgi:hypothetical protein
VSPYSASSQRHPKSPLTSGECVAPSSLSRASAPARPMTVLDTFETSRDVRYSVANRGAGVNRTISRMSH